MYEFKEKQIESDGEVCVNSCKNYKLICEVGSGTYGRVFKAVCLTTNTNVALKKIDLTRQDLDGFPITAIREIKLLKMLDHPNIIKLIEIVVSKPSPKNKNRGSTFLVFEYMDHDFVGLKMKINFNLPQIKCIILQILHGVKYLHEKKIMHRDLKSANILLNNKGEVKIADFGLSRQISNHPQMLYTNKVVTLWYRAPEILLGAQNYNTSVDIWSVGCIFVELITQEVLFPGDKEAKQIELIYEKCGTPDLITWAEVEKYKYFQDLRPKRYIERRLKQYLLQKRDLDEYTLDLIDKMLALNPKNRISAEEAIKHECFFRNPLPCSAEEMPKIEHECHEGMYKNKNKKVSYAHPNQEKANNNNAFMNHRAQNFSKIPPKNQNYQNSFVKKTEDLPSNKMLHKNQLNSLTHSQSSFDKNAIKTEEESNNPIEENYFFEKDHDLHFQSDHSDHSKPKTPKENEAISEKNPEKKENLEFLVGNSGLLGLKSLISTKKPKASSPTIANQQVKKEITQPQEKKTQLYNDLDKLFMNNNEKEVTSKKKTSKRKKPPADEFSNLTEKKIKKENI